MSATSPAPRSALWRRARHVADGLLAGLGGPRWMARRMPALSPDLQRPAPVGSSRALRRAEAELEAYRNALCFPPELEDEYDDAHFRRIAGPLRGLIVAAIFIFGAFGILDAIALPRNYPQAWAVRGLTEGLLLICLAATYRWPCRKCVMGIFTVMLLLVGSAVLAIVVLSESHEAAYRLYPAGLLLVMAAAYGSAIGLRVSLLVSAALTAEFVAIGVFVQRALDSVAFRVDFVVLLFLMVGMNLVGVALGVMLERVYRYGFLLERVNSAQRERSDQLLRNIMPAQVAERLRRGEIVADSYPQACVLFADIAGFTPYSEGRSPVEVLALLNELFVAFDLLAEKYDLEKVKTVGDAYMVVSGVPTPRPDCLESMADLAIAMRDEAEALPALCQAGLRVKLGLHAGPVVAALIGLSRFTYDLWGDTVNTSARIVSTSRPGGIHVTTPVYEALRDRFEFQERGWVEVRGKGEMRTWWLIGRKNSPPALARAPEERAGSAT